MKHSAPSVQLTVFNKFLQQDFTINIYTSIIINTQALLGPKTKHEFHNSIPHRSKLYNTTLTCNYSLACKPCQNQQLNIKAAFITLANQPLTQLSWQQSTIATTTTIQTTSKFKKTTYLSLDMEGTTRKQVKTVSRIKLQWRFVLFCLFFIFFIFFFSKAQATLWEETKLKEKLGAAVETIPSRGIKLQNFLAKSCLCDSATWWLKSWKWEHLMLLITLLPPSFFDPVFFSFPC